MFREFLFPFLCSDYVIPPFVSTVKRRVLIFTISSYFLYFQIIQSFILPVECDAFLDGLRHRNIL